jgi:serine protease
MKQCLRIGLLLVLLTALVAVARPSPSLAGGDERVMVTYLPGHGAQVRAALESAGGRVHHQFDRLNTVAVSLPSAALEGIARNPNVVAVEEDARRYPLAETMPWGVEAVQAPAVWEQGVKGEGVTVCIIDSGFYTGHEDLDGVTVGGEAGTDWSTDFCGHGTHVAGTIAAVHNDLGVPGISPNVSLFIVKVFGDDCIWSYSSDLIAASQVCADNGADIISMSLGGKSRPRAEKQQFDLLYADGILSVAAAGNAASTSYEYPGSYDSVISVAAIAQAPDGSYIKADFSQWNDQVELAAPGVDVLSTVPYLATDELTVDGVTYVGNHIEFSPTGVAAGDLVDGGLCTATGAWAEKVVLCERGEISFYDKVMNVQNSGGAAAVIYNNEPGNFLGTLGEGNSSEIIAISLSQEDGQFLVENKLGYPGEIYSELEIPGSGYEAWGGTSMATPHVSAVAALLWSAYPSLTNVEIREAMAATAMDLGAPGRDVEYGYGLVQAYDAWEYLKGVGGGISLTATGYRDKGVHTIDLFWEGASGTRVQIFRDGKMLATTENDGFFTDVAGTRGKASYSYQLCETGSSATALCSDVVVVDF